MTARDDLSSGQARHLFPCLPGRAHRIKGRTLPTRRIALETLMQSDNKFLDDLAKLASSAVGAAHGLRGEMEQGMRAWFDRQLATMDLVSRDEFDTVKAMAEKARQENDALRAEIDALKSRQS